MANEVKILLTVEGNTVKIQEVSQEITKLGQTSQAAMTGGQEAADNYAASLGKQIGIYALAAAAAYKLEQAVVGAFKAGIQAVDDFKLTTIGVAATLTDLAADQSKGQENYSQALAYSKGMYNELELAAARYFASGKDMTQAWNILAQKGIVLKHEEIDALGIIVDRIKLSTQGQVAGLQIAQELRSMITGQARATDQVGMLLKDRIPNLEAELQKHRQIGDVVTWLASQFKGLAFASKDIQGTLESQYSTLGTLLTQVGRGGLGGAYQDIVGWVSDINDYLTTHKDDLMVGIAKGWATIAWTVGEVKDVLSWMIDHTPAIQAATAAGKYGQAAQATPPVDRTFSQQAMVTGKDAFWAAPGDLVDKTTSGISAAWNFASRGIEGWMRLTQEAYSLADQLDAKLGTDWKSLSDFATNPEFWKIAVDTEGAAVMVDALRGKIQGVIDLIARPFNFVINAVVTGLPSWFGGGSPAPGAMPERKLTTPDTSFAAGQEKARLKALGKFQIMSPDFGMLELPEWAMQSSTPPKTKKPGDTGKGAKGGGKGGGGGGADAEANRLNSLFDTLNKDIARLSEGKLSEIAANETKTIEQIYKKTSDRAVSAAEVEILAKQRATLQKAKLQDDFDLKMAKDSGDVFLAIQKDYEKDLSSFQGLTGDKEKLEANRAKKELDARQKFQEQIMSMESSSLSAMAAAAPLLSQQLPIEKALLDIEIKRGDLKMEEEMRILKRNHMISAGQEEELRGLKNLENQYKRYAQERKSWMLEGVSGGLKAGALDRGKEAETRTAQWTIDAMKGAETWLGETGGQAFVDALHGKKPELSKMFTDIGDSLTKQLFKMGTTKLFDSVWASFAGPGPAKLGTLTNPMIVSFGPGGGGIGLGKAGAGEAAYQKSVTAAGKTGMTMGGGGLAGGAKGFSFTDQYFKNLEKSESKYDKVFTNDLNDWNKKLKILTKTGDTYSDLQGEWAKDNQDAFNTEYLGQYQTDFTGMTTGITGAWGAAQGLMTAAGVSGETARLASMVTYGMQGISIIQKIAKGTILTDAYRGAAAAFAWMVELVPPPMGEIAGAAAAAAAFIAISAFGLFGGDTGGIASSAGGDWRVESDGLRMVHFNETIIPAGPAQGLRNLIDNGGAGIGRPGENGSNSRRTTPDRFQATVPITVILKSPEGKVLSRRMERQVVTLVRKYQKVGEL